MIIIITRQVAKIRMIRKITSVTTIKAHNKTRSYNDETIMIIMTTIDISTTSTTRNTPEILASCGDGTCGDGTT